MKDVRRGVRRASRPLQSLKGMRQYAQQRPPRSSHRELIVPPPYRSSARAAQVVRPNARLRRTRHRAAVLQREIDRFSVRHRAAEASIRPTSASRPHVSRPSSLSSWRSPSPPPHAKTGVGTRWRLVERVQQKWMFEPEKKDKEEEQ